jgi:23S rRNA pseudouridine1911/1915/1917 synthase
LVRTIFTGKFYAIGAIEARQSIAVEWISVTSNETVACDEDEAADAAGRRSALWVDSMIADMPSTEAPGGPVRIVAGPEAGGERVDRFLAGAIGTLSRSRVKSLIVAGQARCDGAVLAEPAEMVRAGAVYTLTVPAPVAARPAAQAIPFAILYEDADLIVLDKPAGLVVHPAPGNEDGTLVNALLAHCGAALPGIGGERRPGIVHRLDKDTSGVMVVAKTQEAMVALTAMFAARDLDRAYLALVWGVPAPVAGEIEGAIGRDRRDRKRMAVRAQGGKAALTRYSMMRVWHGGVSLLECRLGTGRTHQIRVHLAASGHPVVGDPLYLRRLPAASLLVAEPARSRLLDFPRQALHAARLGFRHPRTGENLAFETPVPADFAALVAVLEGGGPSPTRGA